MRPPLMRNLVRSDVEDVIDFVTITDVSDEADGLRVRNRVGEGLSETGVARELDNAHLAMLIRAEVRLVIGQ